LQRVTFTGTVFSGTGEGRRFIELPWVRRQIEEKLGFTPYSGTLNIHLNKESIGRKKLLEKAKRLEVCPEKGYCTGILIKACTDCTECAVIMPQIPSYPNDVLEVIAPWYLRERLNLSDGSEVAVTITV